MRINKLEISGFKSLGNIQLEEPGRFTVFVGPNAAGKSNIFEALEFLSFCNSMDAWEAMSFFGNVSDISTATTDYHQKRVINLKVDLGTTKPNLYIVWGDRLFSEIDNNNVSYIINDLGEYFRPIKGNDTYNSKLHFQTNKSHQQFFNFTRLFIGRNDLLKRNLQGDSKLNLNASNLERVIKRLFQDPNKKADIIESLQSLIPGFENLEVRTEELSGSDNLVVFEDNVPKPLPKRLISDGTFNLISIIVSLHQSDTPQFLCIEEPENGLNPKVLKELVAIIRGACETHGHYLWLNTHSQSLVSELTPDEIVLVDKKNGLTSTKQIKGLNLNGLRMDEALLTNALGGGIPW